MRARLALACLWLAAGATPAASLDVKSAWAGWIGTGTGSTELALHVPAVDAAGTARLEIDAGSVRVRSEIEMQRGVPRELRLLAPSISPLVIRWIGPDGLRSTISPEFHVTERPLIARVGVGPVEDDQLSLIDVAPADLPRLSGAYTSVAGIVIDAASLASLDAEQTAALLAHVRSCGFALLAGASAEVLAALRHAAGCAGNAVVGSGAAPDAFALDAAFSARPLVSPLEATVARQLAGPDARLNGLIAALAVYLALLGLVVAFTDRPARLLTVPLAALVLISAYLALATPRHTLAIWAEALNGDRTASYVARLQLHDLSRRTVALELPPLLGAPQPCEAREPVTLEWSVPDARFTRAAFPGRLLAEASLCYQGGFPIAQSGRFAPDAAGTLTLTNTGPAAWHDAWLVWHGAIFDLAPLAASGVLRIDPATGHPARSAEQRLAIVRTGWQEASLLIPLSLGAFDGGAGTPFGWLLMHLHSGAQTPT